MQPVEIKSRDGLKLVSYLTLPAGARRRTATARRPSRCRWCCSSTAGRGRATARASTRTTSGSPTAATPCCRSTSAARPASARSSSTPATCSGAARCTTTCSTPSTGRSRNGVTDARQGRDHGRQLRRLRDAGRPDLHAGRVRLRRRHRRPVEPRDAARDDPALLGADRSSNSQAHRRPDDRPRARRC